MVSSSSEDVAIDLTPPGALDSLAHWIAEDIPSSAIVSCSYHNSLCEEAMTILQSYRIPFSIENMRGDTDNVMLIYNRVKERPCSAQLYGCTQAHNALRMIKDLRKVAHPATLDYPSAERFIRK